MHNIFLESFSKELSKIPELESVELTFSYSHRYDERVVEEKTLPKLKTIMKVPVDESFRVFDIDRSQLMYSMVVKFEGVRSYVLRKEMIKTTFENFSHHVRDFVHSEGLKLVRHAYTKALSDFKDGISGLIERNTYFKITYPKMSKEIAKTIGIVATILNEGYSTILRDDQAKSSYLSGEFTGFYRGLFEQWSNPRTEQVLSFLTMCATLQPKIEKLKVHERGRSVAVQEPAEDDEYDNLYVPNLKEGYYERARTYLKLEDIIDIAMPERCYVTKRLLLSRQAYIGSFMTSNSNFHGTFGYDVGRLLTPEMEAKYQPLAYAKALVSGRFHEVYVRGIFYQSSYSECPGCYDGINHNVQVTQEQFEDLSKLMPEQLAYDLFAHRIKDPNEEVEKPEAVFCGHCHASDVASELKTKYGGEYVKIGSSGSFAYLNQDLNIGMPEREHRAGINDWCYSPSDLEFVRHVTEKNTLKNLYMGVEIEMEGSRTGDWQTRILNALLTKGNFHSYFMNDGSLCDGFEVATMPATLKAHMDTNIFDYPRMFDAAKAMGFYGHDTDNSGIHVHVNRDFFGDSRGLQFYQASKIAYLIENLWDKFERFSRREIHQLDQWARKKDMKYEYKSAGNSLEESLSIEYDGDRYVAFNITKSNTFEFRIFRSTLNIETYYAILQLVSNLSNLVINLEEDELDNVTFEDIINFQHYTELTNYCKRMNLI